MDEEHRLLEHERLQMEQIRELDMEELEIEEVDDDLVSSDEDGDAFPSRGDGGAGSSGGFTFDTCLASLHTYLGEVDDTHGRISFLDGGTVLNLPMFYLEGVVLFPESTLPLRVIQPRFIEAVKRALNQVDAPYTIGVIHIYRHPDGRRCISAIGTTAEIRQYRYLDDGSMNVVTRGQQRFRLLHSWIDIEGAPCGEVQIVEEDTPLRAPRGAFGHRAIVNNSRKCNLSPASSLDASPAKQHGHLDSENDWECMSCSSSSGSASSDSPIKKGNFSEPSSVDKEFAHKEFWKQKKCNGSDRFHKRDNTVGQESETIATPSAIKEGGCGKKKKHKTVNRTKQPFQAPMAYWPRWVYNMYDSYSLAQTAAELWRQIIVNPSMDDFVRKPDLLSFYIASKLPISESTRQELLEIDGISYRLRREIQLLKDFNTIRCKNCLTLVAKRSDMVVMSTDGPLNAYVNPSGAVHEVITIYNARGLALVGRPVKEHSWFPGYAWTITNCTGCESHMGWLFTAIKKNLLPKLFWGIRSSQIVDDTQSERR